MKRKECFQLEIEPKTVVQGNACIPPNLGFGVNSPAAETLQEERDVRIVAALLESPNPFDTHNPHIAPPHPTGKDSFSEKVQTSSTEPGLHEFKKTNIYKVGAVWEPSLSSSAC